MSNRPLMSHPSVKIMYISIMLINLSFALQEFTYQYEEKHVKQTSIGEERYPNKIKRIYTNLEACKDCFFKNQCLTEKMNHRNWKCPELEDKFALTFQV